MHTWMFYMSKAYKVNKLVFISSSSYINIKLLIFCLACSLFCFVFDSQSESKTADLYFMNQQELEKVT